jgi:hypothetical protein
MFSPLDQRFRVSVPHNPLCLFIYINSLISVAHENTTELTKIVVYVFSINSIILDYYAVSFIVVL